MKGLRKGEVLGVERAAVQSGWTESELLRLAGHRLGWAVGRFFPRMRRVVGYLGKGHNAGDLVVALGVLRREFGWEVAVRCAHDQEEWAPLLREVWNDVGGMPVLTSPPVMAEGGLPCLLLDGLAGVGLHGGLREPLAGMASEIRQLRERHGLAVGAVDIPSGLDVDTGSALGDHVVADVTFQIANPKIGLLGSDAVNAAGALSVVPVEPLTYGGAGDWEMIAPQSSSMLLPPIPHNCHKGMRGRVSLLAGSREYSGAAVLCATGALRAGAGYVILHVPQDAVELVLTRCPPEIIVRGVGSPGEAFVEEADSYVVGCGLGGWAGQWHEELVEAIIRIPKPMVVDADALNQLAARGDLGRLSARHVITPHPGEFRRLHGGLSLLPREDAARNFTKLVACTLLYKGARSLIATAGKPLALNPTGHRGMATAGQGDFLAGVIGAMMGRGMAPHDAACLGAWICGRCGELAVWEGGRTEESLCPSDAGEWIGRAFEDWRTSGR